MKQILLVNLCVTFRSTLYAKNPLHRKTYYISPRKPLHKEPFTQKAFIPEAIWTKKITANDFYDRMRIHQFLHQTVFKLDFFYARIPSHHKIFLHQRHFYKPVTRGTRYKNLLPHTRHFLRQKTFTQKPFLHQKTSYSLPAQPPFLTSVSKMQILDGLVRVRVSRVSLVIDLLLKLQLKRWFSMFPQPLQCFRACWTFETMAKCKFEQQSCILFIYLYLSI